mgnify:CR=1 FL=1
MNTVLRTGDRGTIELTTLRAELEGCPRDRGGRRVYSATLAERAGRYAQFRRAKGVGLSAVALELGVWESQVVRWVKRQEGAGFHEVTVVEHEPKSAVGLLAQRVGVQKPGLVIVSPRGFRLEGLTLTDLHELWGEL